MSINKFINFFHRLFVPKEENNFRAQALHLDFLTYYLVFALILTFGLKKLPISYVLGYATDITTEKLYQLTNEQREKYHLTDLNYNQQLADAARAKAQDMFNKNYWSHYGPDGTSPWGFVLGAGYKYEYAGENLAKNFLFSQGVVDAWMNSKTHRENILRRDYSDVGFSVVNGILNGEETTLVVQMFGKPLSSSLAKIDKTIPQSSQPIQPQPINNQSEVLAKQINNTISLKQFSLNLNLVFLIFLTLALIADFYFSIKLNIIKIGGKNVAHLIFITFIIFGLAILTRGAII